MHDDLSYHKANHTKSGLMMSKLIVDIECGSEVGHVGVFDSGTLSLGPSTDFTTQCLKPVAFILHMETALPPHLLESSWDFHESRKYEIV